MRKFHDIVQCWRAHNSSSLLPIIMSYFGYNTQSWWEQWHKEGLRTLISPFKTRLGKERFQDEMKAAVRQQGGTELRGLMSSGSVQRNWTRIRYSRVSWESSCCHQHLPAWTILTSSRLERSQQTGGLGQESSLSMMARPPSYLTTSWCQQSAGPLEVTVPLGPCRGGFRAEDGGIRWSHQW